MDHEPNLVTSGKSQNLIVDDIPFEIEIYKLEGEPQWSLEVVTRDGTSIVWDDLFDDDEEAFKEAVATIRAEGARNFERGGSNVIPFKT